MNIRLNDPRVRYTPETYDRFTATVVRPFDEAMCPIVIEQAARRMPGAVLLDIGTGTARFLIYVAEHGGLPGLRLVGTDLFDDMLAEARRAADAAGVEIELIRDDVHAMRLPDAFADVITSRSTIHHWQDPAQAFREIDRVLKPDGIAIITDVRRDAPPEAVDAFNRLRAEAGLPPSVLDEKYTVPEMEAFCRAAGIADRCRFHVGESGLAALGVSLVLRGRGR